MQIFTLTLALAGLITSSIAAPTPEADSVLEARAGGYTWSVSKWRFERGDNDYDYSFKVSGSNYQDNIGFAALCSGTNSGGAVDCTVLHHKGPYVPSVSSDTKIVGGSPKVTVTESWTDDEGCVYTNKGSVVASANSGPGPASKFTITPAISAVC